MAKETKSKFILSFSKEELKNSNIKVHIRELIELKLDMQRHKDFIAISPAEFEIIKITGEFVDKSKYDNNITFKGEVGKIRGKKLVIE